jgi:voltage-gated potassium channel Kch
MTDVGVGSRRWVLLAAGVLITLALGVWGFALAQPQNSLADHFYRAVQLFVLEMGDVQPPMPWPLEVARLAAPALTVTSAVVAVLALSRNRLDAWRARRLRGHVVVCGLDRLGAAAALILRRAGHSVVAVHTGDSGSGAVRRCRSAGVRVVLGDPSERDCLARAGVATAAHVVVLTPDLEKAGSVALAAIDLAEGRADDPLTVHLEIGRPELATLLRAVQMSAHASASWRLEELDLAGVGARAMLDLLPPWPPGAERAEVLVAGATPLADAVEREVRRRWRRDGRDPATLGVTRVGALGAPTSGGVASAYVCLDDDADALATSLVLTRAGTGTTVLVHLESASALGELVHRDSPRLQVVRLGESVLTPEVLLDSTVERVARALHAAYRATAPAGDASAVPWEQLPDALRRSNRAQAAHVAEKLHTVRYVLVPDDGSEPDAFTAAEVERLSVLEHERWVRERRAAGWTTGPRDAVALTTPYLVPWDELDEPVRELDRQFVRALPDILADAGLLLRHAPTASSDGRASRVRTVRSG